MIFCKARREKERRCRLLHQDSQEAANWSPRTDQFEADAITEKKVAELLELGMAQDFITEKEMTVLGLDHLSHITTGSFGSSNLQNPQLAHMMEFPRGLL